MELYTYKSLVNLYDKGVESVKSGNSDAFEIEFTKAAGYAADFIDRSEAINKTLTLNGTIEDGMEDTITAAYLGDKTQTAKQRKDQLFKMLSSYLLINTYNAAVMVLQERNAEEEPVIRLQNGNLILSFRSPSLNREIRFDIIREVRKLMNNNFKFTDDSVLFSLAPLGTVIIEKVLKKM